VLFVIFLIFPMQAAAADAASELWQKLRSGTHFAMIRHAIAPGFGDPDDFRIGDCSTQRNLSDGGREQARRIGDLFRGNSIASAALHTSQWCRCRETAELLDLGAVNEFPALNSFFQRPEREAGQMAALRQWLSLQDPDKPLVLVTHQVNITALTGVYPASGEIVVVQLPDSGEVSVAGTIRTD
jgi:phosphohistidine phosphatase SixA